MKGRLNPMISKTKNQTPFNNYCVMSQKLAGILMTKGFKLHSIGQNKKYPNRNVFYFTYSDEIIQAIKEYNESNMESNNR